MKNRKSISTCFLLIGILLFCQSVLLAENLKITVDYNTKSFVDTNGNNFFPWGFNYTTNAQGLLIEEVWDTENGWDIIEEDFQEMKYYCANVVRIHLQYHEIMLGQQTANPQAITNLERLIELAEDLGLYLDITGIAAYRKDDQPTWYDEMNDLDRWIAHVYFWVAVAQVGKNSNNVLCYNLMNEPVVSVGCEPNSACEWLPSEGFGEFHFVQNITRNPNREFVETMESWIDFLSLFIHGPDPDALITYGKLSLGAVDAFAEHLDYLSPHHYPKSGQIQQSIDYILANNSDRPLIIEEIYTTYCSAQELEKFLDGIDGNYQGLMGHYFGRTIQDYESSSEPLVQLRIDFLNFFIDNNPNNINCSCPNANQHLYRPDNDNDNFGANGSGNIQSSCVRPVGYVRQGGDCNDNNAEVNPDRLEKCDGIDNNCNEQIDDDVACITGCSENIYIYTNNVQPTSAEIMWDSNGIDTYTFYMAEYNNPNNAFIVPSTTTNVTFTGLTPGTVYLIIAFAGCNSQVTVRSEIIALVTPSLQGNTNFAKIPANTINEQNYQEWMNLNVRISETKIMKGIIKRLDEQYEQNTQISISPNPSKDFININVDGVKGLNYAIYDIIGGLKTKGTLEFNNSRLNVANFPNGIYIMQLEGDVFSETRKFVIKR